MWVTQSLLLHESNRVASISALYVFPYKRIMLSVTRLKNSTCSFTQWTNTAAVVEGSTYYTARWGRDTTETQSDPQGAIIIITHHHFNAIYK